MEKTKVSVFTDFRGQQYVRETIHHGNATIKRCYEIERS